MAAPDVEAVLAKWGIRSLSPSSLTCWADDRATWVLRYGLKARDPSNPAMIRGNAVEAAVKALLYGKPLEQALDDAQRLFALECEENKIDPAAEDAVTEAGQLLPMIEQGAAAIEAKALPVPVATQLRCEAFLDYDDYSIPVGGYADFVFAGWTLDLKTTTRMPSEPKPAHVAQVSCYAKARNEPTAGLLYLTPKKWALYPVESEDLDAAWRILKPQGRSMIRALARAKTVSDLCADFPPPIDSWAWNPERRAAACALVPEWL